MEDIKVDIRRNDVEILNHAAEPWRITLFDTGLDTQIGGRIKRILPLVSADEAFCLTHGDGVGDVDITAEIEFHRAHGRLATVTAVQPPGRFGVLKLDGERVTGFQEKPADEGGRINGGFFVLSPKVGNYIEGDKTVWEREPMETLAREDQLRAWTHTGFWRPMDTLRDKRELEAMWDIGTAPWKVR